MGISYSVEVDEERTAKAMGRELQVSIKDAVEVCRHVKGEPYREARATLRSVVAEETPVPMKKHNTGVGHRSDIDGWDAGRFPKKATEEILDVLYNAESNAENQGYDPDEMVIQHIAAHKVGESRGMKPRAMGRATEWNADLIDLEVVLLQEDYDPEADDEDEEDVEEVEEVADEAEEPEETSDETEAEEEQDEDGDAADDEADAEDSDEEDEAEPEGESETEPDAEEADTDEETVSDADDEAEVEAETDEPDTDEEPEEGGER